MKSNEFTQYMMDFYGPSGIYPNFHFSTEVIETATRMYRLQLAIEGSEFHGDTVDRENVRDLILDLREINYFESDCVV